MNSNKSSQSIKLIANDGETIHFLSAIVQDSISCTAWFLSKNNTFKILINRVCWEKPRFDKEGNEYISRIHSILTISNLEKVTIKSLPKKKIQFFSILSISCTENEKTESHKIQITLSKGSLTLIVSKFSITMQDVSSYWVSSKIPEHTIGKKEVA